MRVEMAVWDPCPLSIEVLVYAFFHVSDPLWECWEGKWWVRGPYCEEITLVVAQWDMWVNAYYKYWLGIY